MSNRLIEWLLNHLSWIILPILGYIIINLIVLGGRKGIKRILWRTGEEERGVFDIHNILILILLVLLILVIWRL